MSAAVKTAVTVVVKIVMTAAVKTAVTVKIKIDGVVYADAIVADAATAIDANTFGF